jgi:ABC-type Zn2+ transport system substrate-binding protein/surface adhesin
VRGRRAGASAGRYIWKVGAIATIPSAQVVELVGPTVARYLDGRLREVTDREAGVA